MWPSRKGPQPLIRKASKKQILMSLNGGNTSKIGNNTMDTISSNIERSRTPQSPQTTSRSYSMPPTGNGGVPTRLQSIAIQSKEKERHRWNTLTNVSKPNGVSAAQNNIKINKRKQPDQGYKEKVMYLQHENAELKRQLTKKHKHILEVTARYDVVKGYFERESLTSGISEKEHIQSMMRAEIKYRNLMDEIESIKKMKEEQLRNIELMLRRYEQERHHLEMKNFNYGDLVLMIQYELNRTDPFKPVYTNVEHYFSDTTKLRLKKERRDKKRQPPAVMDDHDLLAALEDQMDMMRNEALGVSESDPFGIEGQVRKIKEHQGDEEDTVETPMSIAEKAKQKYLHIQLPQDVVESPSELSSPTVIASPKRKKSKRKRTKGSQTDVELWGHYNMEQIIPVIMKKLEKAQMRKVKQIQEWHDEESPGETPVSDSNTDIQSYTNGLTTSSTKEQIELEEYRIRRMLEMLREFKDDVVSDDSSIRLFSVKDQTKQMSDEENKEYSKLKRRVVDLNRVVTRLRMDLSVALQKNPARQYPDVEAPKSPLTARSPDRYNSTPTTPQSTHSTELRKSNNKSLLHFEHKRSSKKEGVTPKNKSRHVFQLSSMGGNFKLPFSSVSSMPTPTTPSPKSEKVNYPSSLAVDPTLEVENEEDDGLLTMEQRDIKSRITAKLQKQLTLKRELSPSPLAPLLPPTSQPSTMQPPKKMSVVSFNEALPPTKETSPLPKKTIKKTKRTPASLTPTKRSSFSPTTYEKLTTSTRSPQSPLFQHEDGRLSAKSKSRLSFMLHHEVSDPLRLQWGKEKAFVVASSSP